MVLFVLVWQKEKNFETFQRSLEFVEKENPFHKAGHSKVYLTCRIFRIKWFGYN
jgi:hypothetical protein